MLQQATNTSAVVQTEAQIPGKLLEKGEGFFSESVPCLLSSNLSSSVQALQMGILQTFPHHISFGVAQVQAANSLLRSSVSGTSFCSLPKS